jgi:hypothetical protein
MTLKALLQRLFPGLPEHRALRLFAGGSWQGLLLLVLGDQEAIKSAAGEGIDELKGRQGLVPGGFMLFKMEGEGGGRGWQQKGERVCVCE